MRVIPAKIWNKHYKKENIWQDRKPTVYVKDFKKFLKKGSKILEIGFGKGNDLVNMSKLGLDCYGIEISKIAVERVRARSKNLHLFVGKAEKLPFKRGSFDGVYCVRTLYHLIEEKAMPEMIRVLKKDGILYLPFVTSMVMLKMNKNIGGVSEKKIVGLAKGVKMIKRKTFVQQDKTYKAKGVILVFKKS